MSDAERILAYVDEQLAGMRRAPLMWGPPIAIEMQYLQLLETRLLVMRPDLDREQPRLVLDRYIEFLRKKHPKAGNGALANLFDDASAGELVAALHDFENALSDLVAPRSVFETHPLAIALRLRPGVTRPSSTTLTAYLENLRRVLRATLRGPGRTGRSTKEIEELTEFELPSVSVREANGAPAQVVFPLIQRQPRQTSLIATAEDEVRSALTQLVTVMDWAAGQSDFGTLARSVTDSESRRVVAHQGLRLVPRGEVEALELGGTLIQRPAPVTLRPESKARLVSVVAEDQQTEPFLQEGEIRALDLDDATFRLRGPDKAVNRCWLQIDPFELLSEWKLGAKVRVHGRRVGGVFKAPVVIVDDVELIDGGQPEEES